METIALLVIFFAIAIWAVLSQRNGEDKVRVTMDARAFPDASGAETLQIEIRNFGPRGARVEKLVIDGDVAIIGASDDWRHDRNTLRPDQLELPRYGVAFVDVDLRCSHACKAIWLHGMTIETGMSWTVRQEILRKALPVNR